MQFAHVRSGRVVTVYPGSAEADVRRAAELQGVDVEQVPDTVRVGAVLVNGTWQNPPSPSPPPPPPRSLPSTEFRARFTAMEEAAVLTLARTDPVVQAFYSRLLDPRQKNIWRSDPQVAAGLGYLATLDDPLRIGTPQPKVLTAARVAEILA